MNTSTENSLNLLPIPLQRLSRPYVVLSWAQSADGQIATRTGDSKYLSSPESLQVQQLLRRDCEAVLVGIGTVLADDPRLLCRLPEEQNPEQRQPHRIVLDAHFQTPGESCLCSTSNEGPVLVIGAQAAQRAASGTEKKDQADTEERIQKLAARGVQIARVAIDEDSVPSRLKLSIPAVLDLLYERGIRSLFVEGGSAIITSFLKQNLADRVILDLSPRFIGQGIPAVRDLGVLSLGEAKHFRTRSVATWGENLVWVMER